MKDNVLIIERIDNFIVFINRILRSLFGIRLIDYRKIFTWIYLCQLFNKPICCLSLYALISIVIMSHFFRCTYRSISLHSFLINSVWLILAPTYIVTNKKGAYLFLNINSLHYTVAIKLSKAK